MIDEGVDQRSGPVAGAGMHDETGGFDEHDQVVVLIFHIERDILALGFGVFRLRHDDLDAVVRVHLLFGSVTGVPFNKTAPCSIRAFRRLRDRSPPTSPASHTSMRPSASSPAIRTFLASPPCLKGSFILIFPINQHSREPDDAHRARRTGRQAA